MASGQDLVESRKAEVDPRKDEPARHHTENTAANAARTPVKTTRTPVKTKGTGKHRVRRRGRYVASHTMKAMISDRMSLSTAGLAYYATFALFPAISTLVFLYGLMFDPHSVATQLQNLETLLPPPAYTLISERVQALVSRQGGALTIGLIISVAITYWSASTGTKSLLSALNLVYGEEERRGIIGFQLIGLGMTLSGMLAAVFGIAILVGLPAAISFLGLSGHQAALLKLVGVTALVIFVFGALTLLYRFGPSRSPDVHRIFLPGSITSTVLWMAASVLFSIYVTRVASYNAMYGPLAAVIGVMMWFYVSAYVVLFGAELNAALESSRKHQT
ncbi:MAG: YihY/virulence factor BrkB family protein [Acetobacteraceae bacterium]